MTFLSIFKKGFQIYHWSTISYSVNFSFEVPSLAVHTVILKILKPPLGSAWRTLDCYCNNLYWIISHYNFLSWTQAL